MGHRVGWRAKPDPGRLRPRTNILYSFREELQALWTEREVAELIPGQVLGKLTRLESRIIQGKQL